MKTWLKLLSAISVLLLIKSAQSAELHINGNGIVVSRIGPEYMFIFPSTSIMEPKGSVHIGPHITISYWLRINRGGKSRFISMDASKLPPQFIHTFQPYIKPETGREKAKWSGGFYISSTTQPRLDITISQKLWEKIKLPATREQVHAIEQTLSREANLNVEVAKERGEWKIIDVMIQ